MPLCLPGTLTSLNKSAIDWHNSGLLAYGSHNTLVFVDVITQKVFQTLTKHYANITKICWQPSRSFTNSDLVLRCASADSSGHIIVWNVLSGRVAAKFFSQNHAVSEMKWLDYGDASCDFLLVLHSKTLLVLWNITSSEPVWQSRLSFNAFGFSIDPFNSNNVAFNSNGSRLVFVGDLKPNRAPTIQPSVFDLRESDKNFESSIQQLVHHRAYPDLIFALFKDQLMCVDSAMRQVIYNIHLTYPVLTLLPCADRDAFYSVQTNGLVSLHIASFRQNSTSELPAIEVIYDKACHTEVLRGSTKFSLSAAALCSVYQTHVSLLYNTGKLIFYQLQSDTSIVNHNYRLHTITDHIRLDENLDQHYTSLRLRQVYQLNALASNITVLRMRSMSAIDDDALFGAMQLAAVGTGSGVVHLIDAFTCRIIRSFQIHSTAVKSLEWSGGNLLISSSSSASLASSSSTFKNELFACDIQTGQKQRIRPEGDESSIELLRVSGSGRYLAIVFRHDPLEIWDLNSMRLLRRMSKHCPTIVDMVWFGKKRAEGDEAVVCRENLVILDVDNRLYHVVIKGIHVRDGKEVNTEWKNTATILRLAYKQELLVFGDSTGRIRVWDLVKKESRQTSASQSNYGPVSRLAFTSLAGDSTLAVQHNNAITVWDIDNLQLLQMISFPGLNVVDSDMCGVSPIYVLSDGAIRYSTSSNHELCGPVPDNEIPLLLNEDYQKTLIKYARTQQNEIGEEYKNLENSLGGVLSQLDNTETLRGRLETVYMFLGQTLAADVMKVVGNVLDGQSLPCRLWQLWPRERFRKRMERVTKVLIRHCKTAQHVESIAEKAIVLGQRDWATYLLLNFEHEQLENKDARLNAFKACLLAADLKGEEAQCLVKLTASYLIASDFISDGVQLLYLINQEADACRYLTAQGDWSRSFAYSKLLPNNEAHEMLSKFTQHLASIDGLKSLIVLLLASFREWEKCKKTLAELHQEDVLESLNRVLERGDLDNNN